MQSNKKIMERDLTEGVQIIEPPLEELTKKNSGFKKACLSSCFTAIMVIVLIIVGLKLYVGRGPRQINQLPANYPMSIEVYDEYNLEKIYFISAKNKSRSLRLAGLFTKITVSPALISIESPSSENIPDTWEAKALDLWQFMQMPIGDNTDTIKMEWKDIASKPETMISFYKNKLEKSGFKITESQNNQEMQLDFTNNTNVNGLILVKKGADAEKIPYALLVVNFK